MPSTRAKKNVAVLAVCQALLNSTMSIQIALGGLVGYALASDKSLATLPVTMVVAGTALAALPAGALMRRAGRRPGFMTGGLVGVLGSIITGYAIWRADFWLFAGGTLLFGIFSAFGQAYRFAAADVAPDHFKSKAISWVMAGGVVAGFAGPELAKHTKDWFEPVTFLGPYVVAGLLCAATVLMQAFVDIPKTAGAESDAEPRPLAEIVRNPVFMVAALSGMIGFGTMSLVMTATPLAMVACSHPFDSAATVIQWHVIGMFAPSFFTGSLINRFGVLRIILTGVLLNLVCVAIALAGIDFLNFWAALLLLGVGWNFMFIGGTTLLTEVYRPAERLKTQSLNDFLVFGTVALASLSSGALLHRFGWDSVLVAAVPAMLLTAAAVIWLAMVRRQAEPA